MAGRIDDLEHNINDLMVQAGQGEGTPALTSEHQHQKWKCQIKHLFQFVCALVFLIIGCSDF